MCDKKVVVMRQKKSKKKNRFGFVLMSAVVRRRIGRRDRPSYTSLTSLLFPYPTFWQ